MATDWDDALQAHREQYRDRIIDAAIALVAENGLTKTSMAGLAQRAGIGRATVYKYFPDVEAALLAHVEREVDECAEHIAKVCAERSDTTERVHGYVQAMLEHFAGTQHRLGWATLDAADLSSVAYLRLHQHITKLHEMLAGLLTEGMRDGSFRPDLTADLTARVIVKVLGSLRDDLSAGDLTTEEASRTVWALLTRGMLATEPSTA